MQKSGTGKLIDGGFLTAAGIGVALFFPYAFPELGVRSGQLLLLACLALVVLGLFLFWSGGHHSRKAHEPITRQWAVVGAGQGWVEHRVRNDEGGQIVISTNPGDGADKVQFDINFPSARMPQRAETIEIVFDIDGATFEFDVPETGARSLTLNADLWRDVEKAKQVVAAMRRGKTLRVTVANAGLDARFTLNGAFAVLREVETLGD